MVEMTGLEARPAVRPVRLRFARWALLAAGTLSVAIGVLGIFLPLLPSIEFFLIAGVCYARSSPAAYRWLTTNRLFGRRLDDYKSGRGATLATKIATWLLLIASMTATVLVFGPPLWVTAILAIIVVGVTVHLLTLRTIRRPAA